MTAAIHTLRTIGFWVLLMGFLLAVGMLRSTMRLTARAAYGIKLLLTPRRESVGATKVKDDTVSTGAARYRIFVDDNFHYMDEDERYELGTYNSAEKAIALCRGMVDRDLEYFYKPGMSATELFSHYKSFGEDPFIVSLDGAPRLEYSSWGYAEARCKDICRADQIPKEG
jgi:hypothetical protein